MRLGRRGFLGALAAAAVGVAARLHLPTLPEPIRSAALHWKGVPITIDAECSNGTIYFFNAQGTWRLNSTGTKRMDS